MNKYEIGIVVVEQSYYTIEVEADNATDAAEMARGIDTDTINEREDCQGVDTEVRIEWVGA